MKASLRAAWFTLAWAVIAADVLQVHIVPHTHDDVGWLKTVDEYYYGANNSIQHAGVQYILDTVMDELSRDPNKTFSYVEMAFFTKWWSEQDDATKMRVKTLVNNKQLEFVNAGWCMNDEATTDYNSIIDQMSLGLRFVNDTFGPQARPRVAWHIDPFGHSAEQAAIFAKMGYDAFFITRIDRSDMAARMNARTLEMVWRGSPSLGAGSEIFTGVLYTNHYGTPEGFCYDLSCKDIPIVDDPTQESYNVPDRVNAFVAAANDQAQHYTTNNILMTFGDDFQYENAHQNFKNIDKLIKYVNQDGRVHAFYSTPSRYIDAVHAANKTWTLKTDDFFPYADRPYAYWTGYFTSRPALKGYVQVCNNILQACKQLEAIRNGVQATSSRSLQQAMAVVQHHDGVSGTEQQHVANDYAKQLHVGQVACQELMGYALSDLAAKQGSPPLDLQFCEYLNISVCPASQSDSFNVIVYNPLPQTYPKVVGFPVTGKHFSVHDDHGNLVSNDVIPGNTAGYNTLYVPIPLGIPPLGFRTYFIRPLSSAHSYRRPRVHRQHVNGHPDFSVGNEVVSLTFDGTTGRLKTMSNLASGVVASVDQQFLWWEPVCNRQGVQSSGAYIMNPAVSSPYPINEGNTASVTILEGNEVIEVRQIFEDWVTQTIRLYKSYKWPVAEFEFTVGPIPISDNIGKEVVSRFSTNLTTNQVWYTDANGREMQKRVKNYRPTWPLDVTETVAGNYYPVDSRIYIQDEAKQVQFTVLTDRAQGGTSLNDGEVELMVHRRLLCDDWRGVDQPLNETGATGRGLVITGRHMAVLDTIGNSPSLHRLLAKTIMLPPIYAFTPSSQSYSDYGKYYNPTASRSLYCGLLSSSCSSRCALASSPSCSIVYAGLAQSLPPQVHLLTLQLISPKTLLLRLEHQYQLDEPPYNKSVTISLSNMFTGFSVVSATELVLGANENIDNVQRLKWNVNGDNCGRARYQGHVKKPLHACQPQQHSRRINAKSSHLPIRGPRYIERHHKDQLKNDVLVATTSYLVKSEEKADLDLVGSITEPGSHQGLAVLGIALISMGEDIGPEDLQLPGRQRLHCRELVVCRTVPLALTLLSTSQCCLQHGAGGVRIDKAGPTRGEGPLHRPEGLFAHHQGDMSP
ncbi:hypothetical protein EMCRGX_G006653 [Ephydatia muelleri]